MIISKNMINYIYIQLLWNILKNDANNKNEHKNQC